MNHRTQFETATGRHQGAGEGHILDDARVAAQLDRFADIAASICRAPFGVVSLVEPASRHFTGGKDLEIGEGPGAQSLRDHVMRDGGCVVFSDLRADARFSGHPLVARAPFIRFHAGQALLSPQGAPLGCLCVMDTHPREDLGEEQRHALETLAQAVATLLERSRLERSSRQLAELEQRFEVLTDALPQLVWSTDAAGMVDYLNRGWCEFIGQPPEASYGRQWIDFLHPDDRPAADRSWREAVSEGKGYEIEYRMLHHDGEYRWVLARGMPLRDDAGEITRWIGTCTDIQQQKADAERLELLSRELSHRIKNIFAVIGGLIALTTRDKPGFADTATELRDRVLALGRAHDLVRSRGGASIGPQARLDGLLRGLMAPYQDAEGRRIAICGDEVAIDDRSATPLALFFHELATNAAKHGALSHDGGRVEVTVRQADAVELVWSESGGPPVTETGDRGFGSRLVDMSIVRQLGGTLDYDWRAEGLRVTARIPIASLAR